jgi:hypothetical protein
MMAASSMAPAPMPSVSTTLTAHAGCPTGPAADVVVTRSNAPVPSCAGGANETKPSIVTMPGYGPPMPSGGMGGGMGAGGSGSATMSGSPAMFTGAAGQNVVSGALAVVAGLAAFAL